jgi:hypothetical protein
MKSLFNFRFSSEKLHDNRVPEEVPHFKIFSKRLKLSVFKTFSGNCFASYISRYDLLPGWTLLQVAFSVSFCHRVIWCRYCVGTKSPVTVICGKPCSLVIPPHPLPAFSWFVLIVKKENNPRVFSFRGISQMNIFFKPPNNGSSKSNQNPKFNAKLGRKIVCTNSVWWGKNLSRVARFFLVQHTRTWKNICTK